MTPLFYLKNIVSSSRLSLFSPFDQFSGISLCVDDVVLGKEVSHSSNQTNTNERFYAIIILGHRKSKKRTNERRDTAKIWWDEQKKISSFNGTHKKIICLLEYSVEVFVMKAAEVWGNKHRGKSLCWVIEENYERRQQRLLRIKSRSKTFIIADQRGIHIIIRFMRRSLTKIQTIQLETTFLWKHFRVSPSSSSSPPSLCPWNIFISSFIRLDGKQTRLRDVDTTSETAERRKKKGSRGPSDPFTILIFPLRNLSNLASAPFA